MLSFHYGPMNAGKSVALLQQAHTYSEVDKHILLLVPKTMNATTISSRIGIEKSAIVIDESVDLHFFLADENFLCFYRRIAIFNMRTSLAIG
jgi:thymidine kinase